MDAFLTFMYIIAPVLFALIIAAIIVLVPIAIYTLRRDPQLRLPGSSRLTPKITFRAIRHKFSLKNRQYNAPIGKISPQRKGNRHQ